MFFWVGTTASEAKRGWLTAILSFMTCFVMSCGQENLTPLEPELLRLPPKTITLFIRNYCPQGNYNFTDFIVSNLSASVQKGTVLADFDRDGVPNVYDNDANLNIVSTQKDTNGDGYSDLLMYLGGIAYSSQPNLKLCPNSTQDTDGDGLTDCEENNILHTDPQKIDTDGDGIPDYLEVRNQLNPLDGLDAFQSPASDGISNATKVKIHLPINETIDSNNPSLAYSYQKQKSDVPDPRCFHLSVSNIAIVNVTNGNLIAIYFMEQDPFGTGRISAANVVVPRTVANGSVVAYDFSALVGGR